MESVLVYSTKDIKLHDRGKDLNEFPNPFQISERVLMGKKVVFHTRKTIIRNGKSEVIEITDIPTRNNSRQDDTIKALNRISSLFEEVNPKDKLIIGSIN